jgi:hypothetical protein
VLGLEVARDSDLRLLSPLSLSLSPLSLLPLRRLLREGERLRDRRPRPLLSRSPLSPPCLLSLSLLSLSRSRSLSLSRPLSMASPLLCCRLAFSLSSCSRWKSRFTPPGCDGVSGSRFER